MKDQKQATEDLERLACLGAHDDPKKPFQGQILHFAR